MAVLDRVSGALRRRIEIGKGWAQRRLATRHLHGVPQVTLGETEVMAVVLVRNGAWFLRRFLSHHFALGVRHILVIDNGSTDGTVEICRDYASVTVLENLLPVGVHEVGLRAELAQRVAEGGWFLFLDCDELLELPFGGTASLARLLRWCNRHGHTAVLGQMLDRFSERPYAELARLSFEDCIEAMDLYSLRAMESFPYADHDRTGFGWFLRENTCPDPAVSFKRGGLRRELFGETPMLTKHSLVRNLPSLTPLSHPHAASGVQVADVTVLLHHFKLAGDWIARDRSTANGRIWPHGEDVQRLKAVQITPTFRFTVEEPRRWRGVDVLRQEGFLHASPEFVRKA